VVVVEAVMMVARALAQAQTQAEDLEAEANVEEEDLAEAIVMLMAGA
jgi:hypothetical protein